jgi:hypothetical protein
MILNSDNLIADFVQVTRLAGMPIQSCEITHELHRAPHIPSPLPKDVLAVYAFSLASPSHAILKVGRVGANSNARFQSQHYSPTAARSTLAKSLLAHTDQWPQLGIQKLDITTVGGWLRQHTDRDHFFLAATQPALLLSLLEAFVQCRLRPLFEG